MSEGFDSDSFEFRGENLWKLRQVTQHFDSKGFDSQIRGNDARFSRLSSRLDLSQLSKAGAATVEAAESAMAKFNASLARAALWAVLQGDRAVPLKNRLNPGGAGEQVWSGALASGWYVAAGFGSSALSGRTAAEQNAGARELDIQRLYNKMREDPSVPAPVKSYLRVYGYAPASYLRHYSSKNWHIKYPIATFDEKFSRVVIPTINANQPVLKSLEASPGKMAGFILQNNYSTLQGVLTSSRPFNDPRTEIDAVQAEVKEAALNWANQIAETLARKINQ